MTQQGTITIELLDGSAAVQAGNAFELIYAEAFAEPPYNETDDDVAAAFRRFPVQARNPTFRAALARTEDGEPIGMAYGHPLGPATVWWDELTEPVPDDMRREDGQRTFGLMELNVHPAGKAASAAYRAWGYRKIGEARPWGEGADLHDVMLLDLH
ncbi:GNAT family N-acetyltransferase [Streptomyces sp. NPDC006463]|uniref:GNAT family N-acetyltransferase n=1 Tax=Streptomyces sp. NPDC006463 TaxID=3364746 RepID=UPI0036AA9A8A